MPADRERTDRKRLGAWYTPPELVDRVVDAMVTDEFVASCGDRPIDVLDPACGDGRFLVAVGERLAELGAHGRFLGIDIDPGAAADTAAALADHTRDADVIVADALTHEWSDRRFDLVIGNPPFLSQLASATTRGGSSRRGGGPYADVAVEFLALGADLARPDGGRLAFVLPHSVLAARDAGDIRRRIDARATMCWAWWSPEQLFDAEVRVCALGFELHGGRRDAGPQEPAATPVAAGTWARVVTDALGIPGLPALATAGRLRDRACLNANFRDEYYGMAPAVGDHDDGPPLVTSGLIDPGVNRWGRRSIRMARRRFERPRIALDLLEGPMRDWAAKRLVPKVLLANQTRILEAVCDADGSWLPGVPVVAAYPAAVHWDDRTAPLSEADRVAATAEAWNVAAVVTSPVASAWAWHRQAGTGLSAESIRVSPTVLGELPWPAGDLAPAVRALRAGDIGGCGAAVDHAYGITAAAAAPLEAWWRAELDRIERRAPR